MTSDVKIFAKTIEDEAREQIERLAGHPVSDGSKIRIMPDVHAGAGCTIGTTMTITDRICPNLVGVDIGCGMLAMNLGVKHLDFAKLDSVIRWSVPSGFNIHPTAKAFFDLDDLRCPTADKVRANRSLGTLGGGNHFIEVNRAKNGELWLVIHCGSRHLGLEVANYYQNLAWKNISEPNSDEISATIARYKAEGRQKEIAAAIASLKSKKHDCGPKDLAYLSGDIMFEYLHDMGIVQRFADKNRMTIADAILRGLGLGHGRCFTTTHNYIDLEEKILRKGAVASHKGEQLLIPMNMRDGSLLCEGKGNPDWNCSAPHGAGRLMSRAKAKDTLTLGDYRAAMEKVYTTCVSYDTIDEAPAAYKKMSEIIECIEPTCTIVDVLKPVYNFKAS